MKTIECNLHLPPTTPISQSTARVRVCRVEGQVDTVVGETLFLTEDGTMSSTIANSRLGRAALIDAQAALRDRRSFTMRYSLPNGAIDLLVEWIAG